MIDWAIPLIIIATLAILFITKRYWRDEQARKEEAPQTEQVSNKPEQGSPVSLQQLTDTLRPAFEESAHPGDLLSRDDFIAGVAQLSKPSFPLEQVVNYSIGANPYLAVMANEALAARADSEQAVTRIVNHFHYGNAWWIFYALRFLEKRAQAPVICGVLPKAQEWWHRNPFMPRLISDFIDTRVRLGDDLALKAALDAAAPDDENGLSLLLDHLTTTHRVTLRAQLNEWHETRSGANYLKTVGRMIEERSDANKTIIEHDQLAQAATLLYDAARSSPPSSVVIVGESGTGKTTLVRRVAERLGAEGWAVFEGSATDILAGQTYIGELEQRMRLLLKNLEVRRRVVWYVPNFHELLYAGQHRNNPQGVIDIILPEVRAGRLCVIGETQPETLERLLQQRPHVRSAFKFLRLETLPTEDLLQLARTLIEREFEPAGVTIRPEVLSEALDMIRHYLGERGQPGALIDLLRESRTRLAQSGKENPTPGSKLPVEINQDDLLLTLSQMTGLPLNVLDDREGLDAGELRALFGKRVMGQPEAVDCLVHRIAMLKAGLTDPNRPVGVFLFAGPTGTGKTEVARTLAEYLFGSPERMIRLDMSEFQEPSAIARILGQSNDGTETDALVNRIRKQPFSVVLLDEFEKSNPRIWDLFLQVFDDGRLTDAQGRLADFRHSIIILTSNLGATEHQGSSLGFASDTSVYSEAQLLRVVNRTFRPEFVNRIDRIVVFRPLNKSVMRDILKKELHTVLQRRGFRNREWAVEWEESAIEFLLDKGFTPDMGARPLRRAIEEHVLSPIAMTIVEHRFPDGDQFLFVKSDGGGIQVEFVDPDVPAQSEPGGRAEESALQSLSFGPLILSPTGSHAEKQFLDEQLAQLEKALTATQWAGRKAALLDELNTTGFWERSDRFEVLAAIEAMDRMDAALHSARSLEQRLTTQSFRATLPTTPISNLAQQIYLLSAAVADWEKKLGTEVFLLLEAVGADGASRTVATSWVQRLGEMYLAWAQKRHMRWQRLSAPKATPVVLAISGFGVHGILSRDIGMHLFETEDSDGEPLRAIARLRVLPQPTAPNPRNSLQVALDCFAREPEPTMQIVRRYRDKPSPLVRDALAGWRTGRLDRVLAGDFDLQGRLPT